MAKQSTTHHPVPLPDTGWISLKKAAEVCRTTTDDLKQRIKTGHLRAYTIERGGKRKFRVTRAALISAGLLGGLAERADPSIDLLALIREQNQRIAALEDQRAQLSGQLGVALERLRSMDQRLSSLEAVPIAAPQGVEAGTGLRHSAVDGLRQSIRKTIAAPAARTWRRQRA